MKDSQQLNELMSQWWDNQQKLLNQWLNTATSKSDIEAPVVGIFNQAAHTQEKMIDICLETQAAWSQQMRDMVDKQEQLPESVNHTLMQIQTANDNWRELRGQLWHSWFSMIQSTGPALVNSDFANKAVAACQESARQILEHSTGLAEPIFSTKPTSKRKDKDKVEKAA